MLYDGRLVLAFNVRERVGAAAVADQERIALGKVTCTFRPGAEFHQAAVSVGALAGGNTLGDDCAGGVLAQVNHLGAGVGLLVVVGQCHGIELTNAVFATQDTARILPGDRGAGFDLGPGNLGVLADGGATLGDEVEDAAFTFFITRVPVLHGGVFDLGVVQGHQFNNRSVQLVLVPHGRGATFKVTHVAAVFGNNESTLELSGVGCVDAEIGGQLHGAANALGYIDKRTVGEDRGVQPGEKVVTGRHYRAQVFFDQLRVILDRFGDGTENNAGLGQWLLERCCYGNRIEDGINSHARQLFTLVQGDAQLFVGFQQFRIHFVQALGHVFRTLGRGVI